MVCVGTGYAFQCAFWAVPLPVVRQIGQHTDDLTSKDTWLRIPRIYTRIFITSASFNVTSTVGGLIFVGMSAGLSLGNVTAAKLSRRRRPWRASGQSRSGESIACVICCSPCRPTECCGTAVTLRAPALAVAADGGQTHRLAWTAAAAAASTSGLAVRRDRGYCAGRHSGRGGAGGGWPDHPHGPQPHAHPPQQHATL